MLNLSGGTYKNPDFMTDYYIDFVKKIREFSSCDITIELAPPRELSKLKELHEAGCSAVIMNIEIASPSLRKEICPGKSGISYEHYHKALCYAVKVFGHGMVSSVLIGGIQPEEDIIKECKRLTDEGVFPTIMPFRPFDNCELHGFKSCSPDALIRMSEALGEMLRKNNLSPKKQPGCTECGGCSIENDCYEIYEYI
jgi:biotin synthase-like enzyme